MSEVKVTVLMPVYNAGKYIAEAINSVLMQSFTDFELLIINDGSTDGTRNIIEQYSDPRIRVIEQLQQGIATALNNGLANAKGRYIARFDADDICMPDRLEKQFRFLEANEDFVLVGSDAKYIAENGEHLFDFVCTGHSNEEIKSKLFDYCPFIHSAVMYRKQVVLEAGGYSQHAHTFEDYLLWIQLNPFGKYHNLPEPLIKVRFNPDSITIDEKWRTSRFRKMKRSIIHKGLITEQEGTELVEIIRRQDNRKIKEGAYYALCGKKFLVNNYQPGKARKFLLKASRVSPLRLDNYALYLLSFFPKSFIGWLHSKTPNKV